MLSKPETPFYKAFPLFKIPITAANEVMLCMPLVEIYNFSTINSKTRSFVKTFTSQKLRRRLEICVNLFENSCITIRHRTVDLWKIEIKPSRETEQNSFREGVTWSMSVPNVLASFMFWTDSITELFNTPITTFHFEITSFKTQNQLIIDWLLSKQNTIRDYVIAGEEVLTDDFLAIWNRNLKVTKYLELDLIVRPSFHWDIAIKQQELRIWNADWFKLENLLKAECSSIILHGSELTSIELNRFLQSWLLSESNVTLKFFQFHTYDKILLDQVLDLPAEATEENEQEKRAIISLMLDSRAELTIKRNDGRKAVLSTPFNKFFQKIDFLMNVI